MNDWMNDWNPPERRLRSWTPRSPSVKLRGRLFGAASPAVAIEHPADVRWAWLAPVMCCFLAMMVVTGARNPQFGSFSGGGPTNWLTAVSAHQSYAAYISSDFHSEQNSLQKDPIEWTNGSPRPEPVISAPATNRLIR